MKKKQQTDSFAQMMKGVKPFTQDKRVFKPQPKIRKSLEQSKQEIQTDLFSDTFEAHFDDEGPVRYCRPQSDKFELKKLRRGDYYPDLLLDLHGLRQLDAKIEIVALIAEAKKHQIECCCITHGVSGGVLKQKVPSWLVQHPDVIAFHQAPLEWGGHGSLLVLLDIHQDS
ncbi:endonuclease SmrB [Paraferrimonas haliotis]|uniref:Ribosome rescue factor SmrB n=1 Tax=Paraferrimonas haliotis TaxID=2013866 RepID=A0AA37TJD1_9GAMM|nr:endonuclease SmrB [Paraferrimonas haliotis]GLS82612.1 UPF0115 protein [Paraferrimonas haliotis]